MKSNLYDYKRLLIFIVAVVPMLFFFQNCGEGFEALSDEFGDSDLYASFASAPTVQQLSSSNLNNAPFKLPFIGNGHHTSWDGRLVVYTAGDGWQARIFRPELATRTNSGVNIDNAFSAESRFLNTKRVGNVDYSFDTMGNRSIIMQLNALSFFPASGSSVENNPYKSDKDGNPSANGSFETYDLMIMTQNYGYEDWGVKNSEVNAIVASLGRDVMGHMRMKVVIASPKSANAHVDKTILVQDFMPIKDVSGLPIRGIEPTLTVDGRFFIFHIGDRLHYSFNSNPFSKTGWSTPKKISYLYQDRNVMLDGVSLGERVPLAAFPLKANDGTIYSPGENVVGAYPWISADGTELFFEAAHAFHPTAPARRTGTSVVGRWTGNKIRHIDTTLNKTPSGTDALKLFTSSLANTSSIWNPFNDLKNPAFPSSFEDPTYLIIHSNGGNYSEVGFRDYVEGQYVAAFEMNPGLPRDGVEINYQMTPDTSTKSSNGRLIGGAHFKLVNKNISGRNVADIDEFIGIKGHAILFNGNSAVQVDHNQYLNETSRGQTYELFVKPLVNSFRDDAELVLISKGDAFKMILRSDLSIRIHTRIGGQDHSHHSDAKITGNAWAHVAVSHDPTIGELQLFINGKLSQRWMMPAGLMTSNTSPLLIGPAGLNPNGGSITQDVMIVDQVKVSSVVRRSPELADSAFIPASGRQVVKANEPVQGLGTVFKLSDFRYPAELELSKDKASLGRFLFYEKDLSSNGQVSCASCHDPAKGFADSRAKSVGVSGKALPRHSPVIFNRVFSTSQFWDGRASSLFDQAAGPLINPDEMGSQTIEQVVARLKTKPEYVKAFQEVFSDGITQHNLLNALASFEASLITAPAKFDKVLAGSSSFTESELRGYKLFNGKARCVACHVGTNFTDEKLHNNGFFVAASDIGKQEFSRNGFDARAFKTPTLRNLNSSAPYFHDGSMPNLESVIALYNAGGMADPLRSSEIKPLGLSGTDVADLVAFLGTLNSDVISIFGLPVTEPPKPKMCAPSSTKACTVSNGSGMQTCNAEGTAYGSCAAVSCNAGYVLAAGSCQRDPAAYEAIVKKAYQDILKREAEPAGLEYWVGQMKMGKTEAEVRQAIAASLEALCINSGGSMANTVCSCPSGKKLEGGVCKDNVTACTPNSKASCTITNGSGQKTCNSAGTAYGSCVAVSCNTGYALNAGSCQLVSQTNYEAIVKKAYLDILKREAEPAGLEYWVGQMKMGKTEAEVRQAIAASLEALCINSGGSMANNICTCPSGKGLEGGVCKLNSELSQREFSRAQLNLVHLQSLQVKGRTLIMQQDGNLVIYDSAGKALWSIMKGGNSCTSARPCNAVFQNDGNFVVYQGSTPLWNSETVGATKLIFQEARPYLRILNSGGSLLWSSDR